MSDQTMRRAARSLLGAASFAAGLALASAVVAQTAQGPQAPEQYTLDANNIDVIKGSYNFSTTDVAIGPENGGLSYSRTIAGDVHRGNLDGLIEAEDAEVSPGVYLWTYTVSVGGLSERYTTTGATTMNSQSANGSTLSFDGAQTYTHIDAAGTVRLFSTTLANPLVPGSPTPIAGGGGRITRMTKPNGERWDWYYRSAQLTPTAIVRRIQSVTSSLGYQIKFEYGFNGTPTTLPEFDAFATTTLVRGLNTTIDWCDPQADACSGLTQSWPTTTYAKTFVGADMRWAVTNALNETTAYVFDPGSRLKEIDWAEPGRASTTITYGLMGRASQYSDGRGTWSYAYAEESSNRQITTVTDPTGNVRSYAARMRVGPPGSEIENPRLLHVRDGEGNITYTFYDTNGRLRDVTFPEGNEVHYTRDARGNITQTRQVAKSTAPAPDIVTTATYDATCVNRVTCNQPSARTDARGAVTNYTYDPVHGGVTAETAPVPTSGAVRPQTRYSYQQGHAWYRTSAAATYSASPQPIWVQVGTSACVSTAGFGCAGTAGEVKTTTAYQVGSTTLASNLLPVSASAGSGDGLLTATTTTQWTTTSDPRLVDGPLAGTADITRYVYDAVRRTVGVIAPDPDGAGSRLYPATRTTYNADGQIVTIAQGTTTGQTDAAWAAFSPLQTATTAYDAQGRKVRDIAAAGTSAAMATQYTYDNAGRSTCTAQRMNPAVFGSLPASACVLGTAGTFGPDRIAFNTYDDADRLLSTTNGYLSGVTMTEHQSWTANSKVATRTDGNGNLSTYVYDGFDRISRLRFPNASGGGSSTTDHENWTYDEASNVKSFRNRAGELIGYNYDALNRKVVMGGSAIADRTFTYDNLSRQIGGYFTGGGPAYENTWDALGRMTAQIQAPLGTVSYQYDLAGRRTRITWPDAPAFYVQYDWNLDNGVSAIRENGATSGAGVLASYVYDNLGRRTGITRGDGVPTSYGYDAASRLTALGHNPAGTAQDVTFGFSFNPASQITSRTSSNAAYAFAPTNGTAAYANNGRNQVTSAGGTTITYDPRWNITATGSATYGFNGLNQMTSATVGGVTTGLGYDPMDRLHQAGATRFLHDGVQAIAEYNAAGAVTRRHIPGSGVDETIVSYTGAGTTDRRWLLADERGSIIAQVDSTGAVTAINTYDEYGRPAVGNAGRFQYTGQMWLPEAGVYHYKARAYEPNLARFLQTDPVGYEAGLNLYAYVGGDPVNATDPDGHACKMNNGWSPYCRRATLYGRIDARVADHTRFFGAARLTVTALASLDNPGAYFPGVGPSLGVRGFLSNLSGRLETFNMSAARSIIGGSLRGSRLDAHLIHMEQTIVQQELNALRSENPDLYSGVVSTMNSLLNGSGGPLSYAYSSDRTYRRIIAGVVQKYGPLDYANQEHRELVGSALTAHVRSSSAVIGDW